MRNDRISLCLRSRERGRGEGRRALLLASLVATALLLGCETDEVRALKATRSYLEIRLAELQQLESSGHPSNAEEFRSAIDIPGFVRTRKVAAKVFVENGAVRLTASGTVQECRDVVNALAELRWLTEEWRLRLEKGRCTWEAKTGSDYVTLENALVAPPPKWALPPQQLFSANASQLRASVNSLELQVRTLENRLGEGVLLQGKVAAVKPLIDSMHTRPAPCDVAVLDRELALDADKQGQLLEVESARLIHPLEPRTDFRLRGFVEFQDGVATWHCQDP